MNIEIIKRIMHEKKTTLSLVKAETKKINELLDYTSTNIIELNDLIYPGVKLVGDKIGVPLNNANRNTKPGWEIRLETQIRNIRQAKMIRQRQKAGICWEKREN